MKSELKVVPHSVLPGQTVIEVWFNGEFIATVTGADGPGVRVTSKHTLAANPESIPVGLPNSMAVMVARRKS